MFESRNASGLRGLSLAGNSYPYYQDKKRLVLLVLKTTKKTLKIIVFLLLNLKDITANKKTSKNKKEINQRLVD